jgi:aquaporin NIP
MEIVITFILMTVILTTAERSRILGPISALAVGSVFAGALWFGWNVSGASMNPWRSLCPAIISNSGLSTIWVYFAGPIAGTILAVLFQRFFTVARDSKKVQEAAEGSGKTHSNA